MPIVGDKKTAEKKPLTEGQVKALEAMRSARAANIEQRKQDQVAELERLREENARLRAGPAAQIRSEDFSGAKSEVEISAAGDMTIEHKQIEVIPAAKARAKMAEEAFMNEYVTIMIEADENPDAPTFLEAGHNGIPQYVQRGIPQKIRRKYLYSLIAGKRTQFASAFGKDGSGKEFNRLTGRTSTTHRISVLDDTPQGRAAFAQWMSAPS